jgi:hypothetical protein
MIALVFTVLLWLGMLAFGVLAWRRRDGTFGAGLRDSLREYRFIIPRLAVGIIGAGFVAALLPGGFVEATLGPASGLVGVGVAVLCGLAVPGGPVIAYAIGASALLAGAGTPQVVTFVTAWLLFSSNRTLVWELPIMGRRFVVARVLMALPVPLLLGAMLFAAGV